jgi:hypothetical protein
MFEGLTGLRRWGGLLAACLLVLLATTPAVDEFLCLNDGSATAEQVSGASLAQAPDDRDGPAQNHPDGVDACPHGHCHHGPSFLTGTAALSIAIDLETQPRPHDMAALASQDPGGLERPPRA